MLQDGGLLPELRLQVLKQQMPDSAGQRSPEPRVCLLHKVRLFTAANTSAKTRLAVAQTVPPGSVMLLEMGWAAGGVQGIWSTVY